MTPDESSKLRDDVEKVMKKYEYSKNENHDSYWGVQATFGEAFHKLHFVYKEFLNKGLFNCLPIHDFIEVLREIESILKDLEYKPKPRERKLWEMVQDFFSYDDNPILFQIKVSQRIKDVNLKLDQIIKDIDQSPRSSTTISSSYSDSSSGRGRSRIEPPNQYNASNHRMTMFPTTQ